MKKIRVGILLLIFLTKAYALPVNFVYLNDIDPSVIQDIKYYSTDNFIGRPIKGYDAPKCILTYQTAVALAKVQRQLKAKGFSLKVYDCYRPTTAVADFIAWSRDTNDQKQKLFYYPHVNKADFFKLGYVAEKSGHSRGDTVDLTIVNLKTSIELEMGTRFDFMDELSHPLNRHITGLAKSNRLLLRRLMMNAGFVPFSTEWWHFTFKNNLPAVYYDFPMR